MPSERSSFSNAFESPLNTFVLATLIRLAAVGYNRKEYFAGDNYGDYVVGGLNKPNASGYYLMPQRIGISVAYILK